MELIVIKKAESLEIKVNKTNKLYVLNEEQFSLDLDWYRAIDHKSLILDLALIKYFDASGIRSLLNLKNEYKRSGKKLILKNITLEASELFKLVNVWEILHGSKDKKPVHIAA